MPRSTHDLEEMLRGLLLPGELAREHIKALVKSMDPGQTGLVGLRELVTFVRARQGGGSAINAGKTAEAALRRYPSVRDHGNNWDSWLLDKSGVLTCFATIGTTGTVSCLTRVVLT